MPDNQIEQPIEEVKEGANNAIENAQEYVEVVDDVELQYGDKNKAVKKVAKSKIEKTEEKKPVENKTETVTEEKKAEEKKEEPKKIVTDTEKKEVKKPKYFDPLEETDKKPEAKAGEEKEKGVTKTKEELDKDRFYEDYKKKATEYENFLKTPLGQFVKEAQDEGIPFTEALSQLNYVDYSKIDYANATDEDKLYYDRQLATAYFASKGYKDQRLQDEVNEFVEAGEDRTKRRERDEYIAHLDAVQKDRMQKYLGGIKQSKEESKNRQINFKESVEKSFTKIVENGGMFGMQLSNDDITNLKEDCKNFFENCFNADGSENLAFIQNSMFFKRFGRDKLRKVAEDAQSDGSLNVLTQIVKPDANDSAQQIKIQSKGVDWEAEIENAYGKGAKSNN